MVRNSIKYLLPYLITFTLISGVSGHAQTKIRNYYSEILSVMLNDSDIVARFNLYKNDEDKIAVVVPSGYLFQQDKTIDKKIIIVDEKDHACQYLSAGQTKTIIVFSNISILNSEAKFIIPVTFYELKKNKKGCIWKIFLGGGLGPQREYPYTFIFNADSKQWDLIGQ